MLEDLSNRLPRFRGYEESLPIDQRFEESLLELYTEIICFCARAISFLKTNPHVMLRRYKWSQLQHDFERTMQAINRLSSKVDSEADLAKMRLNASNHVEVLECMDKISISAPSNPAVSLYCNIPVNTNQVFCGREDLLRVLKSDMDDGKASDGLRVSAIYGMAGVGKTQIAREFVRRTLKQFDAIIWINSASTVKVLESFNNVAKAISSLTRDDNFPSQADDSIAETLRWLRETSSTWLIVFDNVDDIEVVRQVWPDNSYGSILITCRHFSITQAIGATTREVLPFSQVDGAEYLMKITNASYSDSSNLEAAKDISSFLDGLPLALSQVGSFIATRRIALQKFLPTYRRKIERIGPSRSAKDSGQMFHSLWDLTLDGLTGDAARLQDLLSLAQPDGIEEIVLSEAVKDVEKEDLMFMADDLSFGDAEEALLEAALIRKDSSRESLSMHRLVQEATLRRMTPSRRTSCMEDMVKLLNWGFPETWKKDVGHQFSSWDRAQKCMAHVVHLVELVQDGRIGVESSNKAAYGQLLLRCSWYMYEREVYDVGWQLVRASVANLSESKTLEYASAVDLSGLIKLDVNKPGEALVFFKEALNIRIAVLGEDDPFIASSLNNIAMAHMELGELAISVEIHEKALELRRRHGNDRIGNSLSNLSSTLLRIGDADKAEYTLRQCPSLLDFTDESFLKTENPRFVGDLVLLSRIRCKQDRKPEGLRLAAKALNFRRRVHGNRYKSCDSMLDVAQLLSEQGSSAPAIELLQGVVQVARTLPDGGGYAARAHLLLSKIFQEKGYLKKSEESRDQAYKLYKQLHPSNAAHSLDTADFEKLTPFMLW